MNTKMNIKEIEGLVNEILPGLSMYVRDVNLSPEIASMYKPGMIIREKGFVDASCRVMGMVTSHRYAILSNHMADLSEYEHGTNWGLYVAKNNAHFKVLDIYEYKGKTQILLLHLPDDNRWSKFKDIKINLEDDCVEDCRTRFENKCVGEIVPELSTEEWLERCKFPIGISDEGQFFENEIRLTELMRTINDVDFRKLYHKLVYIQCPEIIKKISKAGLGIDETKDGVIAYGYIDETCGLSFSVLNSAVIMDDVDIIKGAKDEKAFMILRRGSVAECSYIDLQDAGYLYPEYDEIIGKIRKNYAPKNEIKEVMRNMDFLDEFRNEDFPDDVAVVIFSEGLQMEQVWVRCENVTEEMLYGTLLNEPNQNFGVHEGDEIGFVPIEKDNGLLLVAHIER